MQNLGVKKTKKIIDLEKEFNEIELEFIRIEKRLNLYKDFLYIYKFKGDKHYTVSNFTLELNQQVNKGLLMKQIFKECSI